MTRSQQFSLLVLALAFVCCFASTGEAARPNVLVVLVDDLGYSDLGCYGSEIETPNLDRLAANGLRMTQFYNTAKCHSSRISLLTGCYAYQAGNTALSKAVTSAEVLSRAGYFTAMTGKWHLRQQPTDFGFDRYFGHLSGACNYFVGDKTFRLNGEPFEVPQTGFYTTVANVDYAIRFLDEARQTNKPWYLYIAFNAPHAPLQPLAADYQKYLGRYQIGWDKIRERRLQEQRELGLFGKSIEPSPRPAHIPAWETLDEKRRDFEQRRMTALAGMIDRVDQELGRLIKNLTNAGELEDTLILFVSDNGACPYDRRANNVDGVPYVAETLWSDSTGWAWVRNSPFRYYKQNQFEGGIATPAIVHWPAGLKTRPGSVNHDPAHLVDVLPTLAEICEARLPESWPDRELVPISGISLAPIFAGKSLEQRPPIHLLFGSDRGLRDGDWKAVSFRSQPWELYNIAEDRCELQNLADQQPDRLATMIARWTDMAEHVLTAPKKAYTPVLTEPTGHVHPEWTDFSLPPGQPAGKKQQRGKKADDQIRARKQTSLKVKGSELRLTCTGDDSGIAIDHIGGEIPAGPYLLTFRLRSEADGAGEIYFTTDARTKLPAGGHLDFAVTHDGRWHDFELPLATTERIFALRIDPCSKPGAAIIADLQLRTNAGDVVTTWPKK